MRDSVKNKQALYYAKYIRENELTDDDGDSMGQIVRIYKKAELVYKNIISGKQYASSPSSSILQQYGTFEAHRYVIITSEPCDFDVDDLFWFPNKPSEVYIVSSIYTSLNNKVFGLDILVGTTPYFEDKEEENVEENQVL